MIAARDRVLKEWRTAKRAESRERIAEAIDRFIEELTNENSSASVSSLGQLKASSTSGTAAPLVDEAAKELATTTNRAEYYNKLRQITECCGYRLFIDNTTLGRNRELFIVSPPGNSSERVISTQDLNEVFVWLRQQNLKED